MRYRSGLLLLLIFTSPVFAGPKEDLRDADNSYLYADYQRVLKKIVPLIEPDLTLSDPIDIARAYELGGLAAFYLKDEKSAGRYFEKLVRLKPNFRLDPVKVPPPAVAFYNNIRDQLADEIARIQTALTKLAEEEKERERLRNLVTIQRDIQLNSRLTALVPFGVGQFQNGDRGLGQFFLSTQVLSATGSMILFMSVESLRTESGRFRNADMDRARQLRSAQLITGVSALCLAVVGVLEAQISFESERVIGTERISNDKTPSGNLLYFNF